MQRVKFALRLSPHITVISKQSMRIVEGNQVQVPGLAKVNQSEIVESL